MLFLYRSNIAGLFVLCLYDEIEYLTAVLKTLLTDLTERMVLYSRAKLMFKRSVQHILHTAEAGEWDYVKFTHHLS